MREAVIAGYIRSPIGRYGGTLAALRPDQMAARTLRALLDRTGVDPATIDDVILGCANQAGEDNRNVARMAALLAGLPIDVPGQTVNRLCGSGLQAVVAAAHAIRAEEGELFVAGGVESMTRAPLVMMKPEGAFPRGLPEMADSTLGWRFTHPDLEGQGHSVSLGETAENVARRRRVSREEQDALAAASQRRAARAIARGRLAAEIVPLIVPRAKGDPAPVELDEHPRPDTTVEVLARLRPAFARDGTVTAGNAAGINDGAAMLLVASAERAQSLGLTPLARIVASAVAGVQPDEMGLGPIPASRRALERAGRAIEDMDIVELNEAFASQAIACARDLGLDWRDDARFNPNGGAIALGHPLGASGARLAGTAAMELGQRGGGRALVTMCIGVGQGIAAILEAL
ncbi:MAG: acetyl-CoA C-acyltransferase [Chloroflexi bacterium]|nr:acetyl-CoA C-acyltransferase [Chloroflexota bacterium]